MKSLPHLVPALSDSVGPPDGPRTQASMTMIVYSEDFDPVMLLHWPHPEHGHLRCCHVEDLPRAKGSGRPVIRAEFDELL